MEHIYIIVAQPSELAKKLYGQNVVIKVNHIDNFKCSHQIVAASFCEYISTLTSLQIEIYS